ncbi:sulfatase-like hydrolase/transferase [Arcanobacterium hippocoleae]|uniref:sulfatase-like hydrolase/transferase n=1 Tax=Arcanobacterium hippocoleae TaxID=149017 RepID=UPI00334130D2
MITLPEVLKENGYTCAMVGKWHVGTSRQPAAGFDYWYAHRYGGGPYYDAPIWSADGTETTEPEYFTDAIAREACAFLKQHQEGENHDESAEKPFFLLVNFTAPHSPWIDNHPKELLDLYQDTDFPSIPGKSRIRGRLHITIFLMLLLIQCQVCADTRLHCLVLIVLWARFVSV